MLWNFKDLQGIVVTQSQSNSEVILVAEVMAKPTIVRLTEELRLAPGRSFPTGSQQSVDIRTCRNGDSLFARWAHTVVTEFGLDILTDSLL